MTEVDPVEILQNEPQRWSFESLRSVRYDPTHTTVFARSCGILQRFYEYETETQSELAFRRVTGLPFKGSLGDLIWLSASNEHSADISIGVDSAYVYERTGCFVTPKLAAWGGGSVVPLFDIVCAAINEIENLLNIRVNRFMTLEELPKKSPSNYLAVDHRRVCKVFILGNPVTIGALEEQVRHYCPAFWADHETMSKVVHFEMSVYLNPVQRIWASEELGSLGLGDLVAVQNYTADSVSKSLRGFLRFRGNKFSKSKYEVFLVMNEEDTKLHYGSDDINKFEQEESDKLLAPHEQIELEIHAGRTTILFNDLCSVQAGTLIELREHALPTVTLCVMGSPILEGELVHFQDQLMVQVTRRLD
ncbi:FliM/FliN family flagellar motor switch protein [Limnobacter parvus]|uniref:FliM/FliN family flagellar motor switch protein n=1 Tax=Limnobacter parvus TaxID=2939690 RepID=A0ABT1XIY9_9BURK|nr:FliM/FliN family flagellar motor switch protein [Limnobacter parvus]MCR2747251.1 FliM/FliN family flagellar motor switch protein [Limnobacter parvus]